jgi:DNA polymerase-3 subunit epsilon
MTREIILDTETTGFGHEEHRVIEVGCVELVNKLPTGRTFQHYLNPERPIDFGSIKVHGITDDMVKDAPKFRDIAAAFLEFIGDSPLVAHNADFDVGFLNAELARAGHPAMTNEVIDTLVIARQKLPGQRHGLDALCKTFNVDNSARVVHGALLDAQLLADVYVELTGGLQATMDFVADAAAQVAQAVTETVQAAVETLLPPDTPGKVIAASADEQARHAAFLKASVPNAKWPADETPPATPA